MDDVGTKVSVLEVKFENIENKLALLDARASETHEMVASIKERLDKWNR